MLAPLRFGAGLKGKLIDAAVCGTPAVTTPIGAEGMYGAEAITEPGADAIHTAVAPAVICDELDSFVEQAVRLYTQPDDWQALADIGPELIPKRFDVVEHSQRLMDRIGQLQTDIKQHRQAHFYGMMLRHHSMKSTQYMAQWIEAKNRLLE